MADKTERKPPEGTAEWSWLSEPAIYCDAYSVDYWEEPRIVRFSFGEFTDEDHQPFFRAGIVMPIGDVRQLVRSLNRILKKIDDAEAKESSREKG